MSTQTEKDLHAAFEGESMANRKYLAFAAKAEEEGYPQAARLFRAAAAAETIHANYHMKALGLIQSTKENIQSAIAGETYEYQEMYPSFVEDAKKEGRNDAVRIFTLAKGAEKAHAELYQDLLSHLDEEDPNASYFVCSVCGHIHKGPAAPDVCPVCGSKSQAYRKVD